ncbi:MAG: phage fiber-tail adaptor protein [bacterium]
MAPYRVQDPAEELDWTCDYAAEMDSVGSPSDTISSSTFTIEGGGSPAPVLEDQVNTADTTSINVKGMTLGEVYHLRNAVTTSQGRLLKRSTTIRCTDR